jgi:macrolide transport system ATP-binding/permease protein
MANIPFLHARDLVKNYDGRRVLDNVTLIASPGQRIGLVGDNGVGKSTLLRLLAGREEPDDGVVSRPDDCGFLLQELPFTTVRDVVEDALSEIRRVERLLVELDPESPEFGDALEWAEQHDLWDADRRAELVLDGLKLSDVDGPLAEISGGQRARLALAALLIRRPRAMLLDEPTNHLDDDAMAFLERQLVALPGVVVIASHDRVFLDQVCTDIVDLDPTRTGVTRFGGAYSDYLHAKRAERRRWEQQYADQQQELAALRESVELTAPSIGPNRAMKDRNKMAYGMLTNRVQKQISRRVRNAQHRLDELTANQVARPPEPLRFAAALTGRPVADGTALSLRDVEVPGRLRLAELDIAADARLMVRGDNGAGKSTLLAVLAGRVQPASGAVEAADGVRIGLLAQDVVFRDPQRTPRHLYRGPVPLTELGLLAERDLDRPVGTLSVGQRRRLALAMLVAEPPDVLLLDEPTNHLSLSLAEELESALHSAPGAVVVATHDRWLRRGWTGAELVLADGRIA